MATRWEMDGGGRRRESNMGKRPAIKWHRRTYESNEKQALVLAPLHTKFTCCLAVIGTCQAVVTWANGTNWSTSFFYCRLMSRVGCRLVSLVGLPGGATAADAQHADRPRARPHNVCGFKIAGDLNLVGFGLGRMGTRDVRVLGAAWKAVATTHQRKSNDRQRHVVA